MSALLFGVTFASPVFGQQNPGESKQVEKIDGFRHTPMSPDGKRHAHDPDCPQPRAVTPRATFSRSAPALSRAEVLFVETDRDKAENETVHL